MDKKVLYEGPDISYHNGIVDIKRIRDAGCRCIGLRAGYGKNNVDQKYMSNALACYNLDVDVMLYWFSYAYTAAMAAAEAEYTVAWAGKYWKSCPIAYDFEYDSVNYARKKGVAVSKALATDMAVAFLRQVKDAGYIPVMYTNRDYLQNYFDMERITAALGTVYVWYARYISALPDSEAGIPDIWQYTCDGKLPGAGKNVDMNKYYVDLCGKTVKNSRKDEKNINILNFQKAANEDGYKDSEGNLLVEDGIDGPKTRFIRRQVVLKAKQLQGRFVVGSSGYLVEWWQRRCNEILGHGQVTDGLYGNVSRNETFALQQKLALETDGIAGYNSIQAVFYS